MTTGDDISKRLSDIYRRIDELCIIASKDPAQVQKILSSTLEELKKFLEEQSFADEDRKRTEEALGESELRLEKLVVDRTYLRWGWSRCHLEGNRASDENPWSFYRHYNMPAKFRIKV